MTELTAGPRPGTAVPRRRRPAAGRWIVPALVAESVILAITLSGHMRGSARLSQLPIFYRLFLEDWPLAAAGLALLAAAPLVAPRSRSVVEAVIRWLGERRLLAAAVFAVGAAVASKLVYHSFPLAMDEFGAFFQAKVFAAGHLTGRMPPGLLTRIVGPGFLGFFFSANPVTGQIVSNYWPGFSLMLAPFARAGVPFVLNPILGGLTILAVHRLAGRLYPGTSAPGWAVLFLIASPMFVLNSISFYAMPAHLLLNTLYVILLLDPTPRRLFVAGLTGGLALALHQPFPHAVFALPWVLWLLTRPDGLRRSGFLLAGYIAPIAVFFGGWAIVTRGVHANGPVEGAYEAMRQGTSAAQRAIELLRFVFRVPTSTVLVARLIEFAKLLVWTVPALPFIVLAGLRAASNQPASRLLLISAGLTLVVYFGVGFSQGHGWGNRYFYPAFMAVPVIAAGLVARRQREDGGSGLLPASPRIAGTLAVGSLVLLNATALLIAGRFIGGQLAQLPAPDPRVHQVVVLDVTHGYYTNDLVRNDPFLRDPVIWIAGWGDGSDSTWVATRFPGAVPVSHRPGATIWRLDQ